jgi:uncharacterized protein (TIGR03437 family)
MNVRSAFLALAASAICVIVGHAAPPAGCGTLNAGYQVLSIPTVPGGSQYTGALRLAIWYPTTAAPQPYAYWNTISGMVAQDAPIATCGNSSTKFPLIVFSHGYSGCGIQIVFYTEALARQGYVVAAPDHEDRGCQIDSNVPSNPNKYFDFESFFEQEPESYWVTYSNYRNLDIDNVVNYVTTTWTNNAQVDANRIGISGHSFGGYTAFAKVGGWPQWLPTTYAFQAALMFSPYMQAFQESNTVGNPTVPMMYQGGTADCGITPWIRGPVPGSSLPGAFQQSQFPATGSKYFVELNQSADTFCLGHFAWVNTICGGSASNPTNVQACLANVPNAALIVNWAEAFLDTYVAGQPTPADTALLQSTGAGLNTYWSTAEVPGGSYTPGSPAAPDSIATIKGQNLAPTENVVSNGSLTMPLQLSGISVSINGMMAPLYAIVPSQINFVVPSSLASGFYTVNAQDADGNVIAAGPIWVNAVSPAFFSILPGPNPANPRVGWAAGWAQDGPEITSGLYNASAGTGNPIAVGGGNTFLALAATGVRYATDLQAAINGESVPVIGVPSPLYEGIDQVNVGPIPPSFAGSGTVQVVLTAGGMQSNAVAVVLQ